jgi:hypothetical protein
LNDEEEVERDPLINIVYDAAQYFMSQHDFSVANDQDDEVLVPSLRP